jgi:hypothetical protein
MPITSLVVASLLALLSGQGASDAEAYAIYQARLAEMMAASPGASSVAPVGPVSPPGFPAAAAAASTACLLVPGGGNGTTGGECTACHPGCGAPGSHPVDVTLDSSRSPSLRSPAEVVKRGVFLADGKVTCFSCHDGNSTWKYKIALPPDAIARPRVRPGDPLTYVTGAGAVAATTMPAGSDVSPTPLCKACHGFD